MTRDEAVALIGRRLGYASTTDISDLVLAELKLAQTILERDPRLALPWFLSKSWTFNTVSGTRAYDLPSDFLGIDEQVGLFYVVTSGGESYLLRKDDYNDLYSFYGNGSDTGAPAAYAFRFLNSTSSRPGYVSLFPKPDAVYRIVGDYYAQDTVLTSNVENRWLREAPDILIAQAGMQVAQALEHAAGIRLFTAQLADARSRINADNEYRVHNEMHYVMGA